ncbi:universal stress protein [Paeniglutamicibacter kerguelensis]|uniref:Nucleotide-binding universal stress UspA family protein n=1 Tax=Paeniglutamicibacter kerguelensis TaxID=254788 RepID=A0ABS4XGP7_9MICC|nr:universal stress protein [Paeniglutamicibacter kerguelensis]MBP2387511.1 nucleotide-binding universal stress UspA family protein [Paeniglutamicibacter kerguelensis]
MRYLVGYTADARGAEAIALASAMGGAKAHLDIAIVLPESTPFSAVYPGSDHGYSSILADKVDDWAKQALALVPQGISARVIARSVPSPAEGLILVAKETGAQVIVLGGRRRHMAGFFAPGSVASALLHASPVPVAMGSPEAVASLEKANGKLSRVTAFVGTKPGLKGVVQAAAAASAAQGLPLRVVSLVAQDQMDADAASLEEAIASTRAKVGEIVSSLELDAEVLVASGLNIDDAIAELSWEDGEIAVVGSSRLARKRRLFMGPTAQRMLRTLPVPLVVVPKNYKPGSAQS